MANNSNNSSNINPLLLSPVASKLLDLLNVHDFLRARLVCKSWHYVADGNQRQWLSLMLRAHFPCTTNANGEVVLKLLKTVPLRVQLTRHVGRRLYGKLVKNHAQWGNHLEMLKIQRETAVATMAQLEEQMRACEKVLKALDRTPRRRFVLSEFYSSKITLKRRNKQ